MTRAVTPQARARRSVVLAMHPDRGGDPRAFIAALAALDRAYGPSSADGAAVTVIVRHPRWRRLQTALGWSVHRIVGTRRRYVQL